MTKSKERAQPCAALFEPLQPLPYDAGLNVWWQQVCERAATHEGVALALYGGVFALTPGLAFLAGYQAALRALWPQAPLTLGALCVTEQRSTRPADLTTRFEHGQLTGCKDFVTAGTQAQWLLVAAREEACGQVPRIALAHVNAAAEGVQVERLAALPVMPEIEHGRVQFACAAGERLPGDGWSDYVKPFRTLEDAYVLSALSAWLVAVGRRCEWPQRLQLRLQALVAGCVHVTDGEPQAASTHLLLAGLFIQFQDLSAELDSAFASSNAALHQLWLRDKHVLRIAERARQVRLEKAWASVS